MRVLVTIAARFDRSPDGRVYAQFPSLYYQFFRRYLDVFDEVLVAARVWNMEGPPRCNESSDGPGVSFIDIPPFTDLWSLVKYYHRICNTLRQGIRSCDAYILRVPDFIGTFAWREIRRQRLPFALEVVGDPGDVLQAGGGIRHSLRPLIRFLSIHNQKGQCSEAVAAAYVTRDYLQQNYPPGRHTFCTNYSTIALSSSFFVTSPRQYLQPATQLLCIGTLEVLYKGQDVFLDALAILVARGLSLHLTFAGDGRCRPELVAKAKVQGLEEHVTFLGMVPPETGVLKALDASDLFVLPSRTEGLPKVIIEAMARGLPCIGSTAGGIPELLPPEDMVPPGNALALANKIMEVAQDPARMTAMSARNLEAAQAYRVEILHQRRLAFYRHVREVAESGRK